MQKTFTDQHGRVWVDTNQMSLAAKISIPTLKKYRAEGHLLHGEHWIQSSNSHKKVFYHRDAVLKRLADLGEQRLQQRRVHMEQIRQKCVSTAICPDTRAGLELIRQSDSWTKVTEEKIGDIILSTNREQMTFPQIASILLQRAVKEELEKLQA
jgi:hypothetical protein